MNVYSLSIELPQLYGSYTFMFFTKAGSFILHLRGIEPPVQVSVTSKLMGVVILVT